MSPCAKTEVEGSTTWSAHVIKVNCKRKPQESSGVLRVVRKLKCPSHRLRNQLNRGITSFRMMQSREERIVGAGSKFETEVPHIMRMLACLQGGVISVRSRKFLLGGGCFCLQFCFNSSP